MWKGTMRLTMVAALLCGALTLASVPSPAKPPTQRVRQPTPKQQESLVLFLRHYEGGGPHTASEAEWPTRYSAAFVDLSGDGDREVIVYLMGGSWCGSGGCTTLVLAPHGRSYRIVTTITITWPPILVLVNKSHGWHDIAVRVEGGGIQPGYEAVLRFNGRTYPSNPTVPPARPSSKKVSGRVVISRNAYKTGKRLYP